MVHILANVFVLSDFLIFACPGRAQWFVMVLLVIFLIMIEHLSSMLIGCSIWIFSGGKFLFKVIAHAMLFLKMCLLNGLQEFTKLEHLIHLDLS